MGLLGNLKDVLNEAELADTFTKGLAERVVPALGVVARALLRETLDGLVGLTVTVSRKPAPPKE
jgi:hypothetical protein